MITFSISHRVSINLDELSLVIIFDSTSTWWKVVNIVYLGHLLIKYIENILMVLTRCIPSHHSFGLFIGFVFNFNENILLIPPVYYATLNLRELINFQLTCFDRRKLPLNQIQNHFVITELITNASLFNNIFSFNISSVQTIVPLTTVWCNKQIIPNLMLVLASTRRHFSQITMKVLLRTGTIGVSPSSIKSHSTKANINKLYWTILTHLIRLLK